jgi:hypothetical protein
VEGQLTEFDFSELSEGEFSGDHVNGSSWTSPRHFDKFLKRHQSIASSSVTLDDRFGLK